MRTEILLLVLVGGRALAGPDGGIDAGTVDQGIVCEKQEGKCLYVAVTPLRSSQVLAKARARLSDGKPLTRAGSCFVVSESNLGTNRNVICSAVFYQSNIEPVGDPVSLHFDPTRPLLCKMEVRKEHLAYLDANGDVVPASSIDVAQQEEYAKAIAQDWDGSDSALKALTAATGLRTGAIVLRSRLAADPKWNQDVAREKRIISNWNRFKPGTADLTNKGLDDFKSFIANQPGPKPEGI